MQNHPLQNKRFGKYLRDEIDKLSKEDLVKILLDNQREDNFLIMTDSYKMSHFKLLPKGITQMYSYMEARGGDMDYTVFYGLQYLLLKYMVGVRVTHEDIAEAKWYNFNHFGFDCFNSAMWIKILEKHGGKLPLRIKSVKEGTVVPVKNCLMTIVNTDDDCAPLTQHAETLLMKLWSGNTVAAYSRYIKELIQKYWALTSDTPESAIDFGLHCFGYRGTNSEESARFCGSAHLINFQGSDTMGALKLINRYYQPDFMAGYSVVASEHSVVCAFGRENEPLAYATWIKANPTGTLSLVSDTYNIYNVCRSILPALKKQIIARTNQNGSPAKVVIRPDSGDPIKVLFGDPDAEEIDVKLGVFGILFEEFGYSINSKGYKVLDPHIGVLQGDGVSLTSIQLMLDKMLELKIDTMNLIFGSGGKLLQAHDRDEQKFAIKATFAIINKKGLEIEKDPITDPGKKSKKGYLKLVKDGDSYKTIESSKTKKKEFDAFEDEMVTIFENGELLYYHNFEEIRERAKK